jgi:hypothetical protein
MEENLVLWARSETIGSAGKGSSFLLLLKELAPDEEKFYAEGAEEVEEEIKKSR